MAKELVMYSRTIGCPFINIAKKVFAEYTIPYREIFIDEDMIARENVLEWTGFLSVPTLVVALNGKDYPYLKPKPLEQGKSPRGVNRGSIITEPSEKELEAWLKQHGFLKL